MAGKTIDISKKKKPVNVSAAKKVTPPKPEPKPEPKAEKPQKVEAVNKNAKKPRGKLPKVRLEAVRAGFKQCYSDKNFSDIILVGDRIQQNLLTEDEQLLMYYESASNKV